MDIVTLSVFAIGALIAVVGVFGLRYVAAKHQNKVSDAARERLENLTLAEFEYVHGYGHSAIGFSSDGHVWGLNGDVPLKIEASDVGSWYTGEVVNNFLDGGAAATANLALEETGSDTRFANRETRVRYVLINDPSGKEFLRVGIVDEATEEDISKRLERAFPTRARDSHQAAQAS
ncbi:hypothetical protein [Ponticaulis profundi]|uniref:Uncharacterized protein n=1 Tax=Ponticaulis profundi TaxID=2665222 RepID=A0ABW1SA84_9PROT